MNPDRIARLNMAKKLGEEQAGIGGRKWRRKNRSQFNSIHKRTIEILVQISHDDGSLLEIGQSC